MEILVALFRFFSRSDYVALLEDPLCVIEGDLGVPVGTRRKTYKDEQG